MFDQTDDTLDVGIRVVASWAAGLLMLSIDDSVVVGEELAEVTVKEAADALLNNCDC